MKAINFNFINTLKVVLAYAALVYILAILFTSCAGSRLPYSGCHVGKTAQVDTTQVQKEKKIAIAKIGASLA
jgi:hypothetical protein